MIYIDPPFATGADFTYTVNIGDMEIEKLPSVIEETAYRDTWSNYQEFFFERMLLARQLLSPTGALYVHLDHNVVHSAKVILDELFGEDAFQREIVWRIGWVSGYKSKAKNWIRNHDTLLYYVKDPSRFTFNKTYVPYPVGYERRDGSRGQGYPIEDVWNANEFEFALEGEESLDSIQIKSFSKEKTGYQTQKNLSVVRRVLEASSNPGDLVLDFFGGSGTTAAAAERCGRRWLLADLGRFAIQTTRKRLLDLPDCRPFEVLNLGRYERRYWQGVNAGEAIWEYYRFILDLYSAQQISGFTHLHGQKVGRMVHVGATDAPVTRDELAATLAECAANGIHAVDVLGWEWEMGLNPAGKDELAREHDLDVHLLNIPREVMDDRAVEAGDIHFFELSVADVHAHQSDARLVLELANFLPAVDEYMQEKVQGKVGKWSDWIDYWSVDFDYDGETFVNRWQAYRTRREPSLMLRSDPFQYGDPGRKRVVVKVIDIFGNDTTVDLEVDVE